MQRRIRAREEVDGNTHREKTFVPPFRPQLLLPRHSMEHSTQIRIEMTTTLGLGPVPLWIPRSRPRLNHRLVDAGKVGGREGCHMAAASCCMADLAGSGC